MISAYCEQPSAFPGDTIALRVATDAAAFAVHIYRQGATLEGPLLSTSWIDGARFRGEDHQPSDDWGAPGRRPDGEPTAGWNALSLTLPGDWSSGAYLAILVEGAGGAGSPPVPPAPAAYAPSGQALIVIKSASPGFDSQVLYKLPLFTYQAYNKVGGNSIYQHVDVSLRRPGGGTGGTPWDSEAGFFDPFDGATPRQVFAHWDAKLIAWLEGQGYRVDVCTDWDVHQADGLSMIAPYAVVLSVGHDEYYTSAMRANLEEYVAGGGNLACFSGNTCWWRCEFAADEPFRMLGQNKLHHWSDAEVGLPEDTLIGVSFRNAGEGDFDRPSVGYTLQHTEQWPFEGAGVSDGDVIGGDDGLVGYECDGAPYDRSAPRPVDPSYPPGTGTPPGFMILGTGATDSFSTPFGNRAATIGMYTAAGTVFNAGTTDWARVVAAGDPRVGHITRNVLDRLGGNPKGLAVLGNLGDLIACDGFYSPDDQFRHAIAGTRDGGVTEIFYHPTQGEGRARLADLPGLVDVAGFWSDDDRYRHVITASADGDVHEIFFHPSTGTGRALLDNLGGAFRVAGFYSDDDHYRHAIVATGDGDVHEIFYHPDRGQGRAHLGTFPDLVDIGAFYSPDDQMRHVIVAQAGGTVTEIYFKPSTGVQTAPLATVPGVTRISAYYAADDSFFNRRVAVIGQDGRIHEIRYHPHAGIMRVVLFNEDVVDLGSFFSPDDGYRHAIFATDDGDVEELFFRP
ncbi:MAG TPA: N,N-dimethylformamidase beta subunit family domain-containing protein [Kofleriaceae bacterium]|jgi:hypothetical protein